MSNRAELLRGVHYVCLRAPIRSSVFAVGYRVLTVHQGSPAATCTVINIGDRMLMKEERIEGQPLVPFFDFIMSINGKRLVRAIATVTLDFTDAVAPGLLLLKFYQ